MTHLESLNLRYKQLDQELKALESRETRIYYRGENQKKLMLKKAFESFSNDKFNIEASEIRVSLVPKDDKYNTKVEYSLDTRWRSDEGERIQYSKLNHNGNYFYNNMENRQNFNDALVEAEARMEFMKIAIEKDEQIQADWLLIDNRYAQLTSKFWDNKRELRKAVSDVSLDISKLEEQAEMDTLENENGISFKSKNDYSLPRLDVRHDWEIGQIKNIRVVGKTPSGKSVDLQVTRKWSKWDNEKEQYIDEDKVEVFAKVRFDKVKRLLRNARYNELIVE